MIAPQILLIASVLSVLWGIYLVGTIKQYAQMKVNPARQRKDVVVAMRRVVMALCTWLFVFSFVFRSAAILVGLGDETAGQLVFYALLGANLTGSIFAIASLWFD